MQLCGCEQQQIRPDADMHLLRRVHALTNIAHVHAQHCDIQVWSPGIGCIQVCVVLVVTQRRCYTCNGCALRTTLFKQCACGHISIQLGRCSMPNQVDARSLTPARPPAPTHTHNHKPTAHYLNSIAVVLSIGRAGL